MALTTSALSTYLQNGLIDRLFNSSPTFTQPTASTIHLALFSTQPGETGGTELTYTGYARKPIDFTAASTRSVTQNGVITFGQNTSTSQDALGYGIYTAETGGSLLAYGDINPNKTIGTNNTPSIADGTIILTLAAGTVSDYLARFLLDYAFNDGTDPSTLTKYAFLSTTDFTSSGNASSLTEPADNYARILHSAWTIADNAATNNGAIDFASPTTPWGAITSIGLATALSAGEVLFYNNSPTGAGQNPGSGDTVTIPTGTLDMSIA